MEEDRVTNEIKRIIEEREKTDKISQPISYLLVFLFILLYLVYITVRIQDFAMFFLGIIITFIFFIFVSNSLIKRKRHFKRERKLLANVILWLEGKVDESRLNLLKGELRDRENAEENFYHHDKRESYILCDVRDAMENIGIPFLIPIKNREVPKRNTLFYFLLTFITGIFGLYWLYVALKDPNTHFEYQREWEDKLLDALAQYKMPAGIITPYTPPNYTNQPTISIKRPEAMLILPAGRLIEISKDEIQFGRNDFENDIPKEYINFVSKNEGGKYHFKILKQNGLFYIKDQSTNGTMLNNIDIKDKGMKELKNDDKIILAGINNFIMTFKVLNA